HDSHLSAKRARTTGSARARSGPAKRSLDMTRSFLTIGALALSASVARGQHLLIPMDDAQQNHLKAYGLTFNALKAGNRAEWFINYRGGSFLLPDGPELRKTATLAGGTL